MNSNAQKTSAPQSGLLGKVRTRNKSMVEILEDLGLGRNHRDLQYLVGLGKPGVF